MTYLDVKAMVESFGISYAYYQFDEGTAQPCPFCVFYFPSSSDFLADNANYQKIRQLVIELYTDNKDFALEETIETKLNENGLVYSREETYLSDEKMYMVTYQTSIVVKE